MTDSQTNTITRPRGRGTGFTLMELMVVLFILGLLMAIVVPGIGALIRKAQSNATKININFIDTACQYYKDDFAQLPPSEGGQAAAQLTLLLTGYAGDAGQDATPADLTGDSLMETLGTDDGSPGYGYRVIPSGNIYGPYNGTENIDRMENHEGFPVFADAFGGVIYYYRGENTDPVSGEVTYAYNASDESDDLAPLSVWNNYALDENGKFYRKDYIIVSAGPDGDFLPLAQDPTTDDITNFFKDD
jgi:type II secretion system protein G